MTPTPDRRLTLAIAGMIAVVWICLLMPLVKGQTYYALQPGAQSSTDHSFPSGNRLIDENELRLKGVSGLTIRIRLQHIEMGGRYFWGEVDACVDRCHRTGDVYTLLLMGGESQEPWQPRNLGRYTKAIQYMADKYANDPLCVGIHATGGVSPIGVSEELHWKPSMPRPAIEGAKTLINCCATFFPNQTKIMAIGLPDARAMYEIMDYGLVRCQGNFLVKGNAMKDDTNLGALQNVVVTNAGRRGCKIGWEMVGSEGAGLQKAVNNARTLAKQAGKPIDYLAIYPPDLPRIGGLR